MLLPVPACCPHSRMWSVNSRSQPLPFVNSDYFLRHLGLFFFMKFHRHFYYFQNTVTYKKRRKKFYQSSLTSAATIPQDQGGGESYLQQIAEAFI